MELPKRRRPISDINVTPFVDVMLVMLVIFMVTAPLIQQGVDVQLPKVQAGGLPADQEPLVVTVNREGKLFVQRAEVPMGELSAKLEAIFQSRADKEVFLRADTNVAYGTVARALAEIRKAGAQRVGMVTEPEA